MVQLSNRHLSSYWIKRIILDCSKRANTGHIGSALSIADIIAALYSEILRISSPGDLDRDRFILSNGHAAIALYAALYLKGWICEDELNKFHTDGSYLGVHPEHKVNGIDFSTGSLGMGLSFGAGAALAARLQNSSRRVFVLVSDGECNEGSLWEAVMFASHHKLANLIAIVDLNEQQAFGYTEEVLNLSPLSKRWQAFDWNVHEIDGHNIRELIETVKKINTRSGPPSVIIAHTIFGKDVSYMEHMLKWHYWPMSDDEYNQAIIELENKYEKGVF